MKQLSANELRKLWYDFYTSHGHKIIESASLIPENDPSVLFTTAGMQPLVPYLLGEKHPMGTRLCDFQKCVRTGDIDEVGDDRHLTFFEMMGAWSLGDYFKKEKIAWSYEFLTSDKYLGIDKNKVCVTVFAGDNDLPKDEESYEAWKKAGIPDDRIFFLSKEHNWWGLGSGVGPCGTDSEMFIDTGKPKCSEHCDPSCDCGKYIEIGNDVFMQYFIKNKGDKPTLLTQKNVDCGMGFERMLCLSNNLKSVYDTELFLGALNKIEQISGKDYLSNKKEFRIIADHIRTSTFLLGDQRGILPSNVGQGYVLRRLIRRAVRMARKLGVQDLTKLDEVSKVFVEYFKNIYPELEQNKDKISSELINEINKFNKTLDEGEKEFNKLIKRLDGSTVIDGQNAFRLYDTYGFPIELTKEMAQENGLTVDTLGFEEKFKEHQELSRTSTAGVFKGGLADDSYHTVKSHTAVHLLLAGLRKYIGDTVYQRGSNITSERIRYDFSCDHKLTDDEKQKVEDFVNDAIKQAIPVTCEEMSLEDARKSGAMGIFDSKYGEKVKVYTIGNVSKEICGGPHAKNTAELKSFKIVKEESCGNGIRRIKAIIAPDN
jgi:alanyl-tRNA synthetase